MSFCFCYSADPLSNLCLTFPSKEAAVSYAEKHGNYTIVYDILMYPLVKKKHTLYTVVHRDTRKALNVLVDHAKVGPDILITHYSPEVKSIIVVRSNTLNRHYIKVYYAVVDMPKRHLNREERYYL